MTHVVSADELTLDASGLPTIFLNSRAINWGSSSGQVLARIGGPGRLTHDAGV